MRRAWTVTLAALAAGLLGACADPSSAPGAPRPCPVPSPGVLRTAGGIARVVTEDAGGPG